MNTEEIYKRLAVVPVIIIIVSLLIIFHNILIRTELAGTYQREIVKAEAVLNRTDNRLSALNEEIEKNESTGNKLTDINSASADDLEKLPGIGSVRALAIIEKREQMNGFRSIGDLACVEGISMGTLEKLKGLVTVGAYTKSADR